MKPDLLAVGGQVLSAVNPATAKSKHLTSAYAVDSGTSMSTPYVSGVMALLLEGLIRNENMMNSSQSLSNNSGNQALNKGKSWSGGFARKKDFSDMARMKRALMNNAVPVVRFGTDYIDSVANQGSGLVNVFNTLISSTTVSPPALCKFPYFGNILTF